MRAIVVGYECPTAHMFKTVVRGRREDYLVEMGPWVQGPRKVNWRCSCPDFRPDRYCRHIAVAKRRWCGWIQAIHGGEPVDGTCPRCRRKVSLAGRRMKVS